ncbi:ABC-2 type transport system ATP-binding protein [Fontibacillus panacisegetis]|uniref:ABC-2 type transport system ATP-binding protein n=1 Tax=Fontibacillus panacisegetis TaxID=670482 RepID=A0A1G7J6H3_9BACL|nr:ABC transporter ATP-binding protein [Fontibacillus panacisegetis]SDF20465.1 ABC-2 type transport system ATP-binding protein [Fontibacillus panacisegetis]
MEAIRINKLNKTFKNGKKAISNFNLTVPQGEIFSLLGPNGAGKSTLINILTTYILPTSGEITIMGYDLRNESQRIRNCISCVAQHTSIDKHMSLKENLEFQGRLFGLDSSTIYARSEELIQTFHLAKYCDYKVSEYSGGVTRRLDIAMSLISHPKVLFLDEPTVGMDIESRQILWQMIRTIQEKFNTTIFLTTHYLEEAQLLSNTICIMKEGQPLIQGSLTELRQYFNEPVIRVELTSDENPATLLEHLNTHSYIKNIRIEENSLYITVEDRTRDFARTNTILNENYIDFCAVEIQKPSLSDIFMKFTNEEEVE